MDIKCRATIRATETQIKGLVPCSGNYIFFAQVYSMSDKVIVTIILSLCAVQLGQMQAVVLA